ncbi:uncharacterized protein LOC135848834 [Planococcus citri]|uniref:uncharacterized protein LOC135848834 n=1 Tax=Planococcus citri TaxID=170843 RepID=UPI0031FA29BC
MKKLLQYFLPFFFLLKNVFSAKEPAYILTLDTLQSCKGPNSKEYLSLDHLTIFPNHTALGYMEIMEDIPSTATINFQAFSQNNNGTWIESPLSVENLDLCRFIEKDMWFVPIGRLILNIPERCPIRKGRLRFKSVVIHKRTKGIVPAGCLRAKLRIVDKEKLLCCLETVTKIVEYSRRNEFVCAPL